MKGCIVAVVEARHERLRVAAAFDELGVLFTACRPDANPHLSDSNCPLGALRGQSWALLR